MRFLTELIPLNEPECSFQKYVQCVSKQLAVIWKKCDERAVSA